MRTFLAAYLGAGAAIAGLDAIWLTLTNATLYRPALGPLLAPTFRPAPAVAFYLIYIAGVAVFAVLPALPGGAWRGAAWRGALFGLICYATYDLTNQATLIVWQGSLTAIDMTWGAALTTVGASVGYLVARRFASSPRTSGA